MRSLLNFLIGSLMLFFIVVFIFFRNNLWDFFNDLKNSTNSQIIQELRLENEKLKLELEDLKKTTIPVRQSQYLSAQIYSHYPFNDRNLLMVNAGSENGVKEGMPVLAKEGILIGKVKSVKRTQSEILTVFDSGWRSSVGIGDSRTKAVLKGGLTPKLELIAKDEAVLQGDNIFNLSPDFPLNLKIGNIKDLESSPDNLWRSAGLEIIYKIDEIAEVFIVLDFP